MDIQSNITYNQLPEDIKRFLGDSDEYKNRSYCKEDVAYYQWTIENRRFMEEKDNKRKNYIKQKRIKMAENKRMFGREKCGFCFQAGTSSRLYLSHVDTKSCPTLTKAICNKCGLRGHTRKHCKSEQDKRLRIPFKHNRRPQFDEYPDDMCFTNYVEGDSEDWSDSEEKDKISIHKNNIGAYAGVKEEGSKLLVEVKEERSKKSWASIAKKSL